ncbi:hypothetical protein ZWY2020_008380 [Hordeum vulgare]|nr:hypothetical protein ZWY2020_008380 [Hordeum vulgare]
MGKRRRQECDCGKRRRKHLYLVLDDWDNGFSLHKMDALSLLDDSDDDGGRELERLPDPPAVRITEARQSPMLFAGLGTSIFVANKIQRSPKVTGALVYDTETAAMAMGPAPPENTCCFFVAVSRGETKDEKLYTLGKTYHRDRSEHPRGTWWAYPSTRCHGRAPPPHWPSHGSPATSGPGRASPRPRRRSTATRKPSSPTRCTRTGTPYSSRRKQEWRPAGTYSFDTKRREWRSHGEWVLPFIGRGYFEREIDAWVGPTRTATSAAAGRHGHAGSSAGVEEDGAEVVPRGRPIGAWEPRSPTWATTCSAWWRAWCGGCRSWRAYGGGCGCALHVTVFGLKYNREGEVQATLRRVTKSYAVPSTSWTSLMKRSDVENELPLENHLNGKNSFKDQN